jgi:hypothetical protein
MASARLRYDGLPAWQKWYLRRAPDISPTRCSMWFNRADHRRIPEIAARDGMKPARDSASNAAALAAHPWYMDQSGGWRLALAKVLMVNAEHSHGQVYREEMRHGNNSISDFQINTRSP